MKKYISRYGKSKKSDFYFRPLNKLYEIYSSTERKRKSEEKVNALTQSLLWGAGTGIAAGLIRFLISRRASN